MLVEYNHPRYEIDSLWTDQNEALSVLFPLKSMPERIWQVQQNKLRNHLGGFALVGSVELLENDLPTALADETTEDRKFGLVQACYAPPTAQELYDRINFSSMAGLGLPPGPEDLVSMYVRNTLMRSVNFIEQNYLAFLCRRETGETPFQKVA